MTTDDPLEFEITILAGDDTTKEELARTTDLLVKALLDETDVEVKQVPAGPAPEGSKGDVATLTMTALRIVLPGVIDMIKAWATRGQGRTVKFKGRGIEFEGSPEDLEKFLAKSEKAKKKK